MLLMMILRLLSTRAALSLLLALAPFASAHAERRIRIAGQLGIALLPLHGIRDQQLIETIARTNGQDVVVERTRLGGGAPDIYEKLGR